MDKTIAAFEARRQFGRILQDVLSKGDNYLVERHGEEVAAIVPMQVYRAWKERREEFFRSIRAAAERSNLSEEEAMALAEEAVQAVRAEEARKSREEVEAKP
ncbi:MAG: type II toxin-antitoxin system Phd/YefM family antitoxin [Chloroflexi bacterium]|nr:type II toxin-antitoxin system Phd/YefM family antitoxin [Chloroflexota bacterium]